MNEILNLLADNILLLLGMVMGMALIGLRKLAAKTENTLDDQAVEAIDKNKEGIIAKLAAMLAKLIRPKKDEPKQ
jgi:cytochrome bd-type quinol oxidase subunit 2